MDTTALLMTILENDIVDRPIIVNGWSYPFGGTICLKKLLGTENIDINERLIRLYEPEELETPSIIVQLLDDSSNKQSPGYIQGRSSRASIQFSCIANDGDTATQIANRLIGLFLEPIKPELQTSTRFFYIINEYRRENYDTTTKTYRILIRYGVRTILN